VGPDYYAYDGGNLTTSGTSTGRRQRDNLTREAYEANSRDMTMDGHQRIVHADGKTIIYNYGTINFNRHEHCGGIDYRNEGQGQHDYRRYTAPNRDGVEPYQGRQYNTPYRHEFWDDDVIDQRFYQQQRSQYDYQQRTYAREYPDYVYQQRQFIMPGQQPNYYPQDQYAQYLPQYQDRTYSYAAPGRLYWNSPNNQGGVDGVINDVGRLASIALPFVGLLAHRGGAFIPYESPYQQFPQPWQQQQAWQQQQWQLQQLQRQQWQQQQAWQQPPYAGNWNNVNYFAGQNNGNYWNGGFVPGTYNPNYVPLQPQGYLANNAYAWQQRQLQLAGYAPQPTFAAPNYWNNQNYAYGQTQYNPNYASLNYQQNNGNNITLSYYG